MKVGLSFDGGGVRGLVAAHIAHKLEKSIGRSLTTAVDLLYGTSTGGIIALGMATGYDLRFLVRLYKEKGPVIFGHKNRGGWKGLLRPRYSPAPLGVLLQSIMPERTLGSLPIPTAVTTRDIDRRQARFLKSWKDPDVLAIDAALATSAAWPNYFPPHKVQGHNLVDGGYVGNNPAACCYADLKKRWPDEPGGYLVIAIGTGEPHIEDPPPSHSGGLIQQGGVVIDHLFDGANDAFNYILRQVPDARLIRLQAPLNWSNHALDDVSPDNIANLQRDTRNFLEGSRAFTEAVEVLVQHQG